MLKHETLHSIIRDTIAEEKLPLEFAADAETYFVPLCDYIVARHRSISRPLMVGINGAQGTGKSTLALLLKRLLRTQDLRCAVLSIDDFYLTRQQREALATTEHPLLQTRGVPGTHDLPLMLTIIAELMAAQDGTKVSIPKFDKALDDRCPPEAWTECEGPIDVILIEGWCVGAQPTSLIGAPINSLEQAHDTDGRWREFIEAQLVEYQRLYAQLDILVMLKAPSMQCIIEWRTLQEQKLQQRLEVLKIESGSKRIMSASELQWFIMHYERLTRSMLEHMPEYADVVLDLNTEHRIVAAHYREQEKRR